MRETLEQLAAEIEDAAGHYSKYLLPDIARRLLICAEQLREMAEGFKEER
jgi:hypothetical protein